VLLITFYSLEHYLQRLLIMYMFLHESDNTSDHDPFILQLLLKLEFIQHADKVHSPQVSWAKADYANYAVCYHSCYTARLYQLMRYFVRMGHAVMLVIR